MNKIKLVSLLLSASLLIQGCGTQPVITKKNDTFLDILTSKKYRTVVFTGKRYSAVIKDHYYRDLIDMEKLFLISKSVKFKEMTFFTNRSNQEGVISFKALVKPSRKLLSVSKAYGCIRDGVIGKNSAVGVYCESGDLYVAGKIEATAIVRTSSDLLRKSRVKKTTWSRSSLKIVQSSEFDLMESDAGRIVLVPAAVLGTGVLIAGLFVFPVIKGVSDVFGGE